MFASPRAVEARRANSYFWVVASVVRVRRATPTIENDKPQTIKAALARNGYRN